MPFAKHDLAVFRALLDKESHFKGRTSWGRNVPSSGPAPLQGRVLPSWGTFRPPPIPVTYPMVALKCSVISAERATTVSLSRRFFGIRGFDVAALVFSGE